MILSTQSPPLTPTIGPVTPLNVVWLGDPAPDISLPQWGHFVVVFPLGDTVLSFAEVTMGTSQYVFFVPPPDHHVLTADVVARPSSPSRRADVLVLWLSPSFIADMARFLDIPDALHHLLHRLPLWRGDQVSAILVELARACRQPAAAEVIEGLSLEVIGELLRLMRQRHEALLAWDHHKQSTVNDLLPRLLRARQFVEARFRQQFTVQDVADTVCLSEFHFARLFKTAFDTTVRQYVIRLRLEAARRLLEQPDATVTGTALDVGYTSVSSFIHTFSRQFGLSPAQYQAQMENKQDSTRQQHADSL